MAQQTTYKDMEDKRMVAARLFEAGVPDAVKVAAIATGCDLQTVRTWRRKWKAGGVGALKGRKHTGKPPKLTLQTLSTLLPTLGRPPKEAGYDAHLWTTKLIARLIFDTFGVRYHHDHVGELLHKLDWSCQMPAKVARERDEEAIARWRGQEWPEIKKKVTGTTV
jgi:putative transposase